MSGSLATIASDCIAELLHYIDGNDFISLMMTGNRLLRHKLRQKCSSLLFQEMPASLFPFEALRLPNLRSLSIHRIEDVPTYLDFRSRGGLVISRGHKSLETIELQFQNAFALLLSSDSAILYQPVRDRFPTLTTLIVKEFEFRGVAADALFGELPETLTTLHLTHYYDFSKPKIPLSSIATLPGHLKSLILEDFTISEPASEDFYKEKIFPPRLQHLEIGWLSSPTILNFLPSTLQKIHVIVGTEQSGFNWKASKIPKGAIELYVDLSDWVLELDVPLPSNLERIHFQNSFGESMRITIDDVPVGMKSINRYFLGRIRKWTNQGEGSPLEQVFRRFPLLDNVSVDSEYDVARLPNRLKFLYLDSALRVLSPLPSSLTFLTIFFPLHSDSFKYLPSTLRTLVAYSESKERVEELKSKFPPWNESDMAQLASKVRLEEFALDFGNLSTPYSLAPLSSMDSLKKIDMRCIATNDLLTTYQWLPKSLPRYLNTLTLHCYESELMMRSNMKPEGELQSDGFLRACDLAEVTPHLKSLSIQLYCLVPIKFGPSFFATLPTGLKIFKLSCRYAELEPDAVSMLPRSLRSLSLMLGKYVDDKMSNRHLEGLPESLQELDFDFRPSDILNEKVFEILPKSIAALSGISGYSSNDQSVFNASKRFLESNPLLRWPNN